MGKQSIPQFWFEPSAFGWHYGSAVGNVEQLMNADRIQTEGNCHFTAIDPFYQLIQSPNSTNEIDSLVGSLITNAQ